VEISYTNTKIKVNAQMVLKHFSNCIYFTAIMKQVHTTSLNHAH